MCIGRFLTSAIALPDHDQGPEVNDQADSKLRTWGTRRG